MNAEDSTERLPSSGSAVDLTLKSIRWIFVEGPLAGAELRTEGDPVSIGLASGPGPVTVDSVEIQLVE